LRSTIGHDSYDFQGSPLIPCLQRQMLISFNLHMAIRQIDASNLVKECRAWQGQLAKIRHPQSSIYQFLVDYFPLSNRLDAFHGGNWKGISTSILWVVDCKRCGRRSLFSSCNSRKPSSLRGPLLTLRKLLLPGRR